MARKREKVERYNRIDTADDVIELLSIYDIVPEDLVDKISKTLNSYFNLGMAERYVKYTVSQTPVFPVKLSSLSSQDLADVFGEFSAFVSFTIAKSKYLAAVKSVVDFEYDLAYSKAMGILRLDKGNIESKKGEAKSNEDVVALGRYKRNVDTLMMMLKAEESRYSAAVASLSREVSRREHLPF